MSISRLIFIDSDCLRAYFRPVKRECLTGMNLRACFKIRRRPVFGQKAGWRGATREHSRKRSVSEEQRSQAAFCPKTLRAAGLLPVACVGSLLTARCGDARNSPPWPRPKSLAAGPLPILKQALKAIHAVLIWLPGLALPLLASGQAGAADYKLR